jgi:hypothetical protein
VDQAASADVPDAVARPAHHEEPNGEGEQGCSPETYRVMAISVAEAHLRNRTCHLHDAGS